jgi:hypothetical protein
LGKQLAAAGEDNLDFFCLISPTEDQQMNALPGFDDNPSTILSMADLYSTKQLPYEQYYILAS